MMEGPPKKTEFPVRDVGAGEIKILPPSPPSRFELADSELGAGRLRKRGRLLLDLSFAAIVAGLLVGLVLQNRELRDLRRDQGDSALRIASFEKREPTVVKYLTAVKLLAEARPGQLSAGQCADIARVVVQACFQNSDVGLTEAIIFGLIERESGFNPLAISDAHAYGMMQLLWDTAAPHYREMGFGQLTPALLFDPGLNIEAGIRELVRLRRAFLAQGVDSWMTTLTAYYWGERWAWTLLTTKASSPRLLPSLEYGKGVLDLAAKWKEKGL